YRYVAEGTKPHAIRPKRARMLAFPGTYRAKTTPGVIGSQAGGGSGETRYASAVAHPGTQAREFHKLIAKKRQSSFKREMEEAMREAARKSGHAK
ncbi:MAG: hypothetical protein QM346_11390, partial [Chloroflexota bacterium]|nr:hypothetical protein [Chloroflexota bacterium]